MSSMTYDRPGPRVRVVSDNLDNRIGYASLLAARDAVTVKVRGVGAVIASAARAALRQARLLAGYLNLRRIGTVAATAARWIRTRAAVPLGLLRPVLTPAGAVWALTTATGQRLTRTMGSTALHLLESALMRTTDLAMVLLGRCGRMGRWAAGLIGNASAAVVLAVAKVADKVRTTVGPWVSPDRLHVRVVNAVAGLVFLRQLASLLPPVLRVPAMVAGVAISIARQGREGVGRSVRQLARMLADVADVTFLAAGVVEGDVPVTVGVQPTTGPATVEVPGSSADGESAERSTGESAGSGPRPPAGNGGKRIGKKRSGTSGGRC